MKLIHDVIGVARRVGAVFGRRPRERDLHDEIDFHLAMRQREYESAGADPDEARLAARRRFGNVTILRERTDDMWRFPSLESFTQDIRYGWRLMVRKPAVLACSTCTRSALVNATSELCPCNYRQL